MEISVSEIKVPENLMRQGMNEKGLENLARSINKVGLINPIGVRAVEGGFELVHGARRLAAAKMLEIKAVEATVLVGDEGHVEQVRVMENREREDVNAIDEGNYYKKLLVEKGWTQVKLAEMLQVSAGFVSQRVGAIEWPKSLREAVEVGALSFSTAREIAGIKDYEHLLYITMHAAKNGATPAVAREWKRRSNLDYVEKLRQEADGDLVPSSTAAAEPMVHCHTCGDRGAVKEVSTFTVCSECRALIEAVKDQGLFRENKDKGGATGGEEVATEESGGKTEEEKEC